MKPKPCPFCGNRDIAIIKAMEKGPHMNNGTNESWRAFCSRCKVMGPFAEAVELSCLQWNLRANVEQPERAGCSQTEEMTPNAAGALGPGLQSLRHLLPEMLESLLQMEKDSSRLIRLAASLHGVLMKIREKR